MSIPISYLYLPKLLAIAPDVLHVSTGDRPPFSVVMEIAGALAVVAFDEADARDRPNGRRIELPRPEEAVATTDEQIQAKQRSAASAGAAAECRLILVMSIIGLIQLIATTRSRERKPNARAAVSRVGLLQHRARLSGYLLHAPQQEQWRQSSRINLVDMQIRYDAFAMVAVSPPRVSGFGLDLGPLKNPKTPLITHHPTT